MNCTLPTMIDSCFPFRRSYADSARFFRYTDAGSPAHAVQTISLQDPYDPYSEYDYKGAFVVYKDPIVQ
jgi:hypothetical protein